MNPSPDKLVVNTAVAGSSLPSFQFERDTFAFANELIWSYEFDPRSGKLTIRSAQPPPTYSHRCFVLVRSTRQFFFHARFAPELPMAEPTEYRRKIREVISRSPRYSCTEEHKIVFPGYEGLRALSREQEPLVKAHCGGPWQSYFIRSHWRMVVPTTRARQRWLADQLLVSLRTRLLPIVHLYRFPRVTINHGLALFGATRSEHLVEFDAYDPNVPEHPVNLFYDRKASTFTFPPSKYWGGGALNVYEMYLDGLY